MSACAGTAVRVHLLGDYYPAGDEYDLVHEITGRLIPPGGIPLQVGAVVAAPATLPVFGGQSLPEAELDLLCTHGILHLLGYDHAEPDEEREMFEVQREILVGFTLLERRR